jgi:hypothetical protein
LLGGKRKTGRNKGKEMVAYVAQNGARTNFLGATTRLFSNALLNIFPVGTILWIFWY